MALINRKTIGNAVIVAVCVGAVVAVLYPFFVRRETVHPIPCTSRMKQLGVALNMYYTEYDGRLPSSYLVRHSKEWNQRDFEIFASIYGDPHINNGGLGGTFASVLAPYMKARDVTVWCPEDPASKEKHSKYSQVSYYYKAAVDRSWYGDKDGKRQKEGDFRAPADQIIFWERSSFHWKDGDQTLRNGDSINVTYMDGHTATVRIRNCGYTAAENPPGPLPRSGKGEPAWFNDNELEVGFSKRSPAEISADESSAKKIYHPKTAQYWDIRRCWDMLD